MANCDPCKILDCPAGSPYDLYSLQSERFPFVMVCPPGYDCRGGGGYFIEFVCCQNVPNVVRYIPPAVTDADYNAIIADAQAEVARVIPFCDSAESTPPTTLYWNKPQTACTYCPDGQQYCYTIPQARFAAFSLDQANAAAYAAAIAAAKLNRMCCSPATQVVCAGTAFSYIITEAGGAAPVSWSAGTMPTGVTASFLGRKATIAGTIATPGVYTFNLTAVDRLGNISNRTFAIYAIGILPATLPVATLAVPFSQQLSLSGAPSGTITWSIASGALPTGLTLNSTGLISGTPTAGIPASFTVTATVAGTSCSQAYTLSEGGFTDYWPFEDTAIWSTPSTGKIASIPMGMNPGIVIVPSIHGNGLQHPNPANSGFYTSPIGTDRTELSFDPASSSGITISFWVQFSTIHSNEFNLWMEGYDYKINFLYFDPAALFQVSVYGPPAASDLVGYGTTPSTMVNGTWYMITLVYDRTTEEVILYLNDTPLVTIPTTLNLPAITGSQLRFSTSGGGAEDYIIDEVGISMKSAFSQSRITWLYNSGAGRTWPAVSNLP